MSHLLREITLNGAHAMSETKTDDLDKYVDSFKVNLTIGSLLVVVGIAMTAGAAILQEYPVIQNVLDNLGLAVLGVGVLTFLLSAFVRLYKERMAAPFIEAEERLRRFNESLNGMMSGNISPLEKLGLPSIEKDIEYIRELTSRSERKEDRPEAREITSQLRQIQQLLVAMWLDFLPDDESERTQDRRAAVRRWMKDFDREEPAPTERNLTDAKSVFEEAKQALEGHLRDREPGPDVT